MNEPTSKPVPSVRGDIGLSQARQAGLVAVALSDAGLAPTPVPQSVRKGDRKSKGKDFKTSLRDDKVSNNSRSAGVRPFSVLAHAINSTHGSNAPVSEPGYSPIDDGGHGRYSYEELQTMLVKAQHRTFELEEESRKLKEDNEALKTRFEDQDSVVRKAQESAFAFIKSRAPTAEDDDVIRERLKTVMSQWRPFAKKWALTNFQTLKDEHIDEVNEILADAMTDVDEEDGPEGLRGDKNLTKVTGILLNAELAGFINMQIISRPFMSAFALNTVNDDGVGDSFYSILALDRIYDSTKAENAPLAHSWRAQTVALIDPPDYQTKSQNQSTKIRANNRKQKYYEHLMRRFEASRARALYKTCDESTALERRAELLEIFRSSGEVLSTLWSQKTILSSLTKKELAGKPFQVSSSEYEAHAAHRLEDGETSLNDRPIKVVVQPGIIAWGNEHGESYDSYKVWAKAVVWVS